MTALTLVRNETIKTTRRPAFWVSALALLGILTIVMLERQTDDAGPAGFPDIWSGLIGDVGPIAPFFAAILVILLVTSEFSFRTARQNVIDGLSKNAWFAGKLLLVPAVAAAFIALMFSVGAVGATFGDVDGAIIRGVDLAVLGGYAAGVVMLVSAAFMCAMLVRGSGAAMAVFFFYITLLENLIHLGVGRFSPGARPALGFLPFNVFVELIDPKNFDASILPAQAAAAAAANQPYEAPTLFDPAALLTAGALWTLLFVGVAFLVFRRRDL
ncbi:MAG TPA: ABC transporter permease [Thermoanaerobaculia bacterium]